MSTEIVTGWLCAHCGRYLGSLWPDEHCPCHEEPMRIRIRVGKNLQAMRRRGG